MGGLQIRQRSLTLHVSVHIMHAVVPPFGTLLLQRALELVHHCCFVCSLLSHRRVLVLLRSRHVVVELRLVLSALIIVDRALMRAATELSSLV
jgi:hypothetical protein